MPTREPVLIKPPYPMLAKAGVLTDLDNAVQRGYVIEEKIDGIRCIAVVGDMAGVSLYNRQLRNITQSFPDVVAQLHTAVSPSSLALLGPVVLDGEIACVDDTGNYNFQLVQHRANRTTDVAVAARLFPATYHAFDILRSGSIDYTWTQTLAQRQAILAEVAPTLQVATYTQSEAYHLSREQRGEGLILKSLGSYYVPGSRSAAWLKIKWLHEIDCVIGGVTWGLGKRSPYFGGLLIGVPMPLDTHGDARLTYVGTVGTGFDDDTLESLTASLFHLRDPQCPFATGEDAGWDVKYYVRPLVRVKIRFANWTTARILRHPRFVGVVDV